MDDGEDEEGEDKDLGVTNGKRVNGFGSDEDGSGEGGQDSSEEEQQKRKKKKKKRNKGKAQNGRQQHITAFKGMD